MARAAMRSPSSGRSSSPGAALPLPRERRTCPACGPRFRSHWSTRGCERDRSRVERVGRDRCPRFSIRLRSPKLRRQRKVFPRWADRVIQGLYTQRLGESGIEELLATPAARWRKRLVDLKRVDVEDDPVPKAVLDALPRLDLGALRRILEEDLPLHSSPNIDSRLSRVRSALTTEVASVWRQGLKRLDLDLPLLILDEAHHTKNRYTRLAGLFANQEAREEAETLTRGELGGVFHRMLFLTATPFQLGHNELIEVLDRFKGVRWDDLDRSAYDGQLKDLQLALDASQAAALRLDRSWVDAITVSSPHLITGIPHRAAA
jgi:hypothetical protein